MKRMKALLFGALICANLMVGTQIFADEKPFDRCLWTFCVTDGTGCGIVFF